MDHRAPRTTPPRTTLRPSLEMVERRRRELEAPGVAWWPNAIAYRIAAAGVLAIVFVSAAVGVGTTADPTVMSGSDPAFAAALPADVVLDAPSRANGVAPKHATRLVSSHRHRAPARSSHRRSIAASAHHGDPASQPAASPAPDATSAAAPAASMLTAQPWTLTADGTWTTVASLAVPAGVDPTKTDIAYSSDEADVLPLDANAQGAPGVIVTASAPGTAVTVVASSSNPSIGTQTLELPAPSGDPASFAAVAQAV